MPKIMVTAGAAVFLFIPTIFCLVSDDSPFQLYNKATGFCLVYIFKAYCWPNAIRWTSDDRLLDPRSRKCLGAQGTSNGTGVSFYDCNEKSELQKWECHNETLLVLKGHDLYLELINNGEAILTKTAGPKTHLKIDGTIGGPCTKQARVLYTIGGNAFGKPCVFPFLYKNQWYSDCSSQDSDKPWCAVETSYENELWGYCPTNDKTEWKTHPITGERYQLNIQSALTRSEAEASCHQQSSSLLSITDPSQQAYVISLLEGAGVGQMDKFWTGLTLNSEHGWHWSNGRPYCYLKWDSGYPQTAPGQNCAIVNAEVRFSWQSSLCNKKLGYICYSKGPNRPPTQPVEQGFCASPWIPYSGHCFHLHRELKTWSDAQKECRKEGGDLVSIRHVEDQSFVISQLGYASTDELWIGLNDRRTEGLFDWSDQSTVSFSSWEYGEPSVTGDTEDCVLMRGENGNWADRVCSEKRGFICMKPSASEATGDEVELNTGCKKGWRRHGSYCYFVGTETKTFDEANGDCKRTGSYLTDVSNAVDNAFLISLVGMRPEKYFWIGLSNMKYIDEFVWSNNSTLKYSHWNMGMPGHEKGCVAIGSGTIAGLWDVFPCTNKEKYICKHLAEGVETTTTPRTVAPLKCPIGWEKKSKNYCFKYFPGNLLALTWFEARDYCRAIGGDLISIHSWGQNLILYNLEKTSAWIGLSAPDSTSSYVWSDGSPVNFVFWLSGEPNGKNNLETCVLMRKKQRPFIFRWEDDHCEKKTGFVCQIQIGTTPKPPPEPVAPDFSTTADGWIERNGTQYYFNNKEMANEDAQRFCQQHHSDLVTIDSEAESIFLWNQIPKDFESYWLGLSVDLDGTYQWMDGSEVTFLRWSEGQPEFKYYDENCAAMSQTGYWHSFNCGHEFRSICKRSSSPPVNATVAPTASPKGGCKPNWKQFKSKCYNIIQEVKLKWEDARQQCMSMNSKLTSILTRHEEVFLLSQMSSTPSTDLWIGLQSLNKGKFLWTDSRAMSYRNLAMASSMFQETKDKCAVITTNTTGAIGFGKWILIPCNSTKGYICKQNIDPNLPEAPELLPTDFTQILNDSIKIVMKNLTWDAAKRQCERDDAKLVTLRNEWTQNYVELQAMNRKVPLWIGLNTDVTDGYFYFIDGWHLSFTKWGNEEPKSDRPCVFVDIDGSWKTAFCNQTMASVCMKSTDVPPTESTVFPGVCPNDLPRYKDQKNVWLPFKGHCYRFFTLEKSWPDASVHCATQGATLVSIEDPSEQDFIFSKVEELKDHYTSFWIGLFKNHKGKWVWLDKTLMDYSKWDTEQSGFYSKASLRSSDGKWKTELPYWPRPFICKTPKVLPQKKPTPSADPVHVSHQNQAAVISVVVIFGIVLALGIAIFIFKKSSRRLPVQANLSNVFDNPLFFSNNMSQPEVCDTTALAEYKEENKEENIQPLLTI